MSSMLIKKTTPWDAEKLKAMHPCSCDSDHRNTQLRHVGIAGAGGITLKVIEHSKAHHGVELITLVIRYHRFVHAEFMTHRVFSRNASSSRAIPIKKMLQNAMAEPLHWGANRPGMQAGEELTGWRLWAVKKVWRTARFFAKFFSNLMAELGAHKQIANRLTEPFQFIEVVVTATEWDNFLILRDHPMAQPEIAELAKLVRQAKELSTPELRSGSREEEAAWHLPFISGTERLNCRLTLDDKRRQVKLRVLKKISASRCARVSYLNHDGSRSSEQQDLDLFGKLMADPKVKHASPSEHQAYPLPLASQWSRNFRGWRQHRELVEGKEYV